MELTIRCPIHRPRRSRHSPRSSAQLTLDPLRQQYVDHNIIRVPAREDEVVEGEARMLAAYADWARQEQGRETTYRLAQNRSSPTAPLSTMSPTSKKRGAADRSLLVAPLNRTSSNGRCLEMTQLP